jgi:L-2-hydroxyglutarate oxidase LhgO
VTETADCIVVGAGVVGLAVARALALSGREVIVLEAAEAIGTHTSSRNSGVIHAGINYNAGSLKGRLCRRGKELLYAYCAEHGVGHRRLGKILPAFDPDTGEAKLATLKARAEANGLMDLTWLDRAAIHDLEPELDAPRALLSPSSGIVDAHELMLSLRGEIEDHGGAIALGSSVTAGRVGESIELDIGGANPMTLRCRTLINSAGFDAQLVAAQLQGLPKDTIPPRLLAKGVWFTLNGRSPFRHLIYPVGDHTDHHGIHVSIDMGGQLRFGPDLEWVETIDYRIDDSRAAIFTAAARAIWPALPEGALSPGYAGIRAKTGRGRATDNDFIIQGREIHGVPELINLYGIESPGLTSSLAIGEEVARRLATVTA